MYVVNRCRAILQGTREMFGNGSKQAFNIFNRHRLTQPGSDLLNQVGFGFSSIDAGYAPRVVQIRVRFIY